VRLVRRLELGTAALVAGGASFAALAPGAFSSYESLDPGPALLAPPALAGPSASDFADIRVSDASRAVAAALVSGEARAARFSAPPPSRQGAHDGAVRVSPRAAAQSGPAWSGEALGLQLSYAPPTGPNEPRWWIVGGGGRESYAVAAGGLREFTIAPVSASTTVGDSHLGIAMEVGDHAYASLGYVREVRSYTLGVEDWEEEEHYVGVGFQARW